MLVDRGTSAPSRSCRSSIALAAYWAAAGALVGWLAVARHREPVAHRRGVGAAPTRSSRAWPFGGFSWGEVGYAFHDVGVGRALASVGGVALVTFLAVALNAFLADLVVGRARPRRVRAARRPGVAGDRGGRRRRADGRPRRTPHAAGPLRVALLQGNDKNRDLTDAEMDGALPAEQPLRRSPREITDPVDLIVFPESSMDADPTRPDRSCVERPRRRRPRARTRGCSPTRSRSHGAGPTGTRR